MVASGGAPLRQAGDRFVAFFRELQGAFIEREDVLKQIALALLARQHVLMTGPPGTAKSQLATRVLGRIVSQETGRPSLFARQFTESTVQTDLVGPIDFKTLMDTGRTQHFTDEGILGAVHAFLDEVFDGRDMLLRSALNILHERELKEGTKTTAGRIECALMTSNRYLAEILDNERLVAFVDRIAFLSFVPKGFADPDALDQVLRTQVAGRKPPELETRLTIQDLDVLQAAVDGIYVDDSICGALAALIQRFDAELAGARRANPTFVPSRYLSTRTAVRMGSLLRAVCFYDHLFRDPARPLEVARADLAELRLAMTLSGPDPEQTAKLLQRETDPRERRQLTILRTEREIFDRCLAALGPPVTIQTCARRRQGVAGAGGARRARQAFQRTPAEAVARARDLRDQWPAKRRRGARRAADGAGRAGRARAAFGAGDAHGGYHARADGGRSHGARQRPGERGARASPRGTLAAGAGAGDRRSRHHLQPGAARRDVGRDDCRHRGSRGAAESVRRQRASPGAPGAAAGRAAARGRGRRRSARRRPGLEDGRPTTGRGPGPGVAGGPGCHRRAPAHGVGRAPTWVRR